MMRWIRLGVVYIFEKFQHWIKIAIQLKSKNKKELLLFGDHTYNPAAIVLPFHLNVSKYML